LEGVYTTFKTVWHQAWWACSHSNLDRETVADRIFVGVQSMLNRLFATALVGFSSRGFSHPRACSIMFRYGSGTEGFYDYIWDMHSSFPQFPIWITEYADVSDNKTGEFLFNRTIPRGGLSYDSCVLIRGLGFHESNHQLPGFIGLD